MFKFAEDEDVCLQVIEERNTEIRELEQEVLMLGEIFNDIAMLLETQGEQIDFAAKGIENSVIATEEGVINLESAAKYNLKALKKAGIFMATSAAVATGGGIIAVFASPVLGVITLSAGCVGAAVSAYTIFRKQKQD